MEDKKINNLIINELTQAQYDSIENPSEDEWYLITDGTSGGGGSSRNMGEIVASTIPLVDAGLHLLDGAKILGDGIYAGFVEYIANLYTGGEEPRTEPPEYFCTEEEWQQTVATYGVCGKFVYDSVENSVRLPLVEGFTESTLDMTVLGNIAEAGLPNITGNTPNVGACLNNNNSTLVDGAFSSYSSSNGGFGGGGGYTNAAARLKFDASRSNSIYGNSDTVQPQAVKILYYVVIATIVKTDVVVDIDQVATDLNGKMDKDMTNMGPLPTSVIDKFKEALGETVIKTYVSGTSGYRIWSDGYCEQWGNVVVTDNNQPTVTMVKSFADLNYIINVTAKNTNYAYVVMSVFTVTNNSFKVSCAQGWEAASATGLWRACGYLAEGQY